jgi:hypothetical protein
MQLDLTKYVNCDYARQLERALPQAKTYFDERLAREPSFGVASNTFRAFRGIEKPSVIYRDWAGKTMDSSEFSEKGMASNSNAEFETLHCFLSDSLARHWQRETGRSITVAHKYKLIDLFTKYVCRL